MDADLIIEKLRECQEEIDNWEGVRVNVIETADFRAWQDRVKKWLKAAGPLAADDLKRFSGLLFFVLRARRNGLDGEDQERYERDLGHSRHIIDSAIESLELEARRLRPEATVDNQEESRGEYTTALICEKGHVTSLDYGPTAPQEPYCKECGAKTLSACPKCDSPIHGQYFIPGEIDLMGGYSAPNYCQACGTPYPWTQARRFALTEIIAEMQHLSAEDRAKLVERLPDLAAVTPQTEGAILRMQRALQKAAPGVAEAARRLLIQYATEEAKKRLGLG